jgi:antitoxin component YwqK of YwqJK toxin-antitoxin module/Tfp pilus assembly protein PilF
MKVPKNLLFLILLLPVFVYAQRDELVNSGEVIKKAQTLYDSSQYKSALTELDRVNRSDTNYVYSLYLKALSCEADSQYARGVKYCKEELVLKEQREHEPDLFNTYGNILNDMKDQNGAMKVFDEAISKYPSSALLYFNKGIVYMHMNKPADAEIWFKKALFINPYMYSAHYQLAYVALLQGKIIPGTLSLIGYLLMNPEGRYSTNAIKLLSEISNGNDEIINLKTKRTAEPGEDYQTVEEIVMSKIALDKAYKPIITLDDPISRQIQVIFEKLDYQDNDDDFWMQYYYPFYKKVFTNGQFELFINHIFAGANLKSINEYNKRYKKEIAQMDQDAGNYFDQIRMTRELFYKKRDTVAVKYVFDNGQLIGKGKLLPSGKSVVGPWVAYYQYGNLKATGNFDVNGSREGDWTYYYFSGALKSKEHYLNGKLQGAQEYYHENGNLSSKENYNDGLAEGAISNYYFTGSIKAVVNYKLDKKSGETKNYYNGGLLHEVENYSNDERNGTYTEYFKNGNKRQIANYVNGKLNGDYKMFYESGELNYTGTYVADKGQGEWLYYYKNGKLKEKRHYVNDVEKGPHEEYYESGELNTSCNLINDKISGELTGYYKDGKVFKKSVYESGVIKSIKYFDESGKVLSGCEPGNGLQSLISYTLEGYKNTHFFYDKNGKLTGPDTVFYPSGKIYQINSYKNNAFNGLSVTYFLNGKVESQVNMTDGKENGHYISYYANGKIQAEGWKQNDEYEGPWNFYDANGRLSSTNYYIEGNENGYQDNYSPNGKKTSEEQYDDGILRQVTQYGPQGNIIAVDSFPRYSGKYKLVYPDGKIMAEANYVNGNFEGAYKEYFFDGSLSRIYYYKAGLLDSTYTSYYYGGVKNTEGRYKFGNRTALWKSYNDDNTLESTTEYAYDELNGLKTYYFENGATAQVNMYKNDKLEGDMKKYDPDGTLAYVINFSDDKPKYYTYAGKDGKMVPNILIANISGPLRAYYPNGQVSREWSYTDGVKNGPDIIYYKNGQIWSADTYAYNYYEGDSKEYFPDGKLKYEYRYDNDNLNGVCRDYRKNGNLKQESVFDYGNNNGPAKFYDENGKLIRTLTYNYGRLESVQSEK